MSRWNASKGSGGQGLVIEEETGRTVAVAYDEKDAPLIAAAPELLELLEAWSRYDYEVKSARVNGESMYTYADFQHMRNEAVRLTDALIAKVKGDA